jgi:hypothetical protein
MNHYPEYSSPAVQHGNDEHNAASAVTEDRKSLKRNSSFKEHDKKEGRFKAI